MYLENLENEKMVMENSWSLRFCDQSWSFTKFASKFYQITTYFAATRKFSINSASPNVPTSPQNGGNDKFEQRDGHGKLRNGHGKVMEIMWTKSVGTLLLEKWVNEICIMARNCFQNRNLYSEKESKINNHPDKREVMER